MVDAVRQLAPGMNAVTICCPVATGLCIGQIACIEADVSEADSSAQTDGAKGAQATCAADSEGAGVADDLRAKHGLSGDGAASGGTMDDGTMDDGTGTTDSGDTPG